MFPLVIAGASAENPSMPSAVSDCHYAQAVLDSVQNGSYPESEEVIAAELPPKAIPSVLKLLAQARNEVKVCLWPVICPVISTLRLLP